ncbi:MAG: polysaccharide deacetylase family protein [Terriglobia bacterium]
MTGLALVGIVIVAAAGLGIFFWYACSVPGSQVLGPALVRGPVDRPHVALTFDDGPAMPFTEQILDVLRERRVRATFFVCGRNVERHPEIARRICAEGHALGNHTYTHPFPYFLPRRRMAEEIDRTQVAIERVTGKRPNIFRPPYGARWFGLYPELLKRGLRVVQWSDTGYDWKSDAATTARSALANLRPGSVILLHDGQEGSGGFLEWAWREISGSDHRAATGSPGREPINRSHVVEALPGIIDGARKAGFEFVPLEDFLS